jgi:putative ubiquitin-RnfH superfamily antitoxin RatB of RatAB toxin-antitoxin module
VITVTVVYALADRATLREVRLAAGATVGDAIAASGLLEEFPELREGCAGVGVFAEAVTPDHPLAEGDRVEIYRPLQADPKETRRRRAARRTREGAPRKP